MRLVKKLISIAILSFIFQAIYLPSAFSKQIDWYFRPSGSSEALPIDFKQNLSNQIKRDHSCCSGTYLARFQVIDGIEDPHPEHLSLPSLGIYLPPIGGLTQVRINQIDIPIPKQDYSSSGPVVPLPNLKSLQDWVEIELLIHAPRTIFSGSWIRDITIHESPGLF